MKNRVVKVITALILSVAVFFNCSVFSFALSPVKTLPGKSWHSYPVSRKVSTGVYPDLPSNFIGFSDSNLQGFTWYSNYEEFDKTDWSVETSTRSASLSFMSGIDVPENYIVLGNSDSDFVCYEIPADCVVRVNNGLVLIENIYASNVGTISCFKWASPSFSEHSVSSVSANDFMYYIPDYNLNKGDFIHYSTVDVLFYSGNDVYFTASSGSLSSVKFTCVESIKYKTFTVSVGVPISSLSFNLEQEYVFDFSDLGVVFADIPHVFSFSFNAAYVSSEGEIVDIAGKDGFSVLLDTYLNPFEISDSNYRYYTSNKLYKYPLSFDFMYSQDFKNSNCDYIVFFFVARCDSVLMLFPGDVSMYDYESYTEEKRWNDLNNKLDFLIDGDTGLAAPVYDDKISGAVDEQDEIVNGLYDSLNSGAEQQLSDLNSVLGTSFNSYEEFFADNVKQLDSNFGEAFLEVRNLFDRVVGATDMTILILFSLTFGFAVYVLGRRLKS